MTQSFKAKLVAHGPGGAWVFLDTPFNIQEVFGTKARVAVSGSINGFPFRNSLMPNGDGSHSMAVNKALQAGAKAKAGDTVSVIMELDTKKRAVRIPTELSAALKSDASARTIFKTLSPSHQKEFTEWVSSAKQSITRISRAAKSLKLIKARAHTR